MTIVHIVVTSESEIIQQIHKCIMAISRSDAYR